MGRWDVRFNDDLRQRLQAIEATCGRDLTYYDSWLHGIEHLREVALLAGWIAAEMGEDVEAAMVAGFLHDCGRQDDGGGNRHAHDSERLARPILQQHFPHLDAEHVCRAIRLHADGRTSEDPLIGALWDADRLTLYRLGYPVREDLLSPLPGKRLARELR